MAATGARTAAAGSEDSRSIHARVHPKDDDPLDDGADTVGNEMGMIVTSRGHVHGREHVEEIGLVSAADVRSKNIIADIFAAVGGIFGGETTYYSHLLNECTQGAMDKLVRHAANLGANGIVNVRFQTTTTMNRMILGMHASVLAYGTAVRLRKQPDYSSLSMHHRPVRLSVDDADASAATGADGDDASKRADAFKHTTSHEDSRHNY